MVMQTDLNKIRRYELKYTISEAKARAIRDYIQPIFSTDPYVPEGDKGYTVNNLYLDTHDLRFYYDVKFRRLTRFKPRMRYYGTDAPKELWLEIKNKHNNVIWKKRRVIPIEAWPHVLDVQASERRESKIEALPQTFEELVQIFGAEPVLHVRYFREPYVSDLDTYGRITFDRSLRYRLANGSYEVHAREDEMVYYDDAVTTRSWDSPVILEIKVETIMPFWASKIIKRFELMQRGFSKYCYVWDKSQEYSGVRNSAVGQRFLF